MESGHLRVLMFLVLTACAAVSRAAPPSAQIDQTVARAMKAFDVPGMAVGVVKDGQVVFAKGYGVRQYGTSGRVDQDTVFQIGSNTKAFTAAAIAILVDEGKIGWDDKVIDYLPDFRLYDPYVTREFTIRDLLTHRSGLGEGAGDLMFYPATDFKRAEIIHGLRYLKPRSGFRAHFDYDNVLYVVAGQIIPAVTGESWESFVERRILEPLGMQACTPSYDLLQDRVNFASPHVLSEGGPRPIPVESIGSIAPAGGINCNIRGMSKWLMMLLDSGHASGGSPLLSAARIADMFEPTTVEPVEPDLARLTATHFKGYGLGWNVQDTHGLVRISHTGGVPGTVTWVSLIPELRLGVLVFTNRDESVAMEAVGNQILDSWLGVQRKDWVEIAKAYQAGRDAQARAAIEQAASVSQSAGPPALPLSTYAGRYVDAWRGDAVVRLENGSLILEISRTTKLKGVLAPYGGNVFVVHWQDRSLNADAYVRFTQGFDRTIEGMTLKAVSPATDFSFDFEDLDFRKQAGGDESHASSK